MTAETLRKAASLMRERAQAATPGPWVQHTATMAADTVVFDGIGNWVTNVDNCADSACRAIIAGESVCSDQAVPNGEHIASWHPAVALAVADWLDSEDTHRFGPTEHAIAVARAYLGEQP